MSNFQIQISNLTSFKYAFHIRGKKCFFFAEVMTMPSADVSLQLDLVHSAFLTTVFRSIPVRMKAATQVSRIAVMKSLPRRCLKHC